MALLLYESTKIWKQCSKVKFSMSSFFLSKCFLGWIYKEFFLQVSMHLLSKYKIKRNHKHCLWKCAYTSDPICKQCHISFVISLNCCCFSAITFLTQIWPYLLYDDYLRGLFKSLLKGCYSLLQLNITYTDIIFIMIIRETASKKNMIWK